MPLEQLYSIQKHLPFNKVVNNCPQGENTEENVQEQIIIWK